MERCISAFSCRSTERGQQYSFDDVYRTLSDNGDPKLIIFSSDYENFMLYSDLFREKFPFAQIMGTTSFFNYTDKGGAETGLSALAVYSGIDCACGVLEEAGRCPIKYIENAKKAIDSLGIVPEDKGNLCCLEFTTAYNRCEELILDTLRKATADHYIPVIGSSAGVRKGTKRSYVSLNGKIYVDACVFMFIRNKEGRIAFFRENSYKITSHFFQVTGVDCEKYIVKELDRHKAASYYASAVGTEIPTLENNLSVHPLGRIYDDKIYITDCERILPDGSMSFYSHIYNYSRAVLLEPDDPKAVADRFIKKIKENTFLPSFSFAINCAFDYDIYEGKGITERFTRRLGETVGCYGGVSGCGEQAGLYHVNKTLLLAVFE